MRFARLKAVFSTLQVRLVIWITAVFLFMVVATMLTVRQVVLRTLQSEFDQVLLADARDINLTLAEIPSGQVTRYLNHKAMGHIHQGWFAEIFDDKGRRLDASENAPEFLQAPDFTGARGSFVEVGPYRVLLDHFSQTRIWIRLGSTKQSLIEDIELLNRTMILATLLIVLVAPLGAYTLAGRATRPLAWIISTTARLQPEKLDERLPIRGTGDELDQMSHTINGMLDRIASYIERHREFIANAAHELRSPLAAIRSAVEVALNRPRSTEEYQTLLGDVMLECSQLGSLVDRLLLLAEGDAGRHPGRDHVARLDKLAEQSVDMFQPVAESKGIDLTVETLEPTCVHGDEVHLRQVIRNLIDNAIKFNLPSGEVRVRVGHDTDRKQAFLVVSDNGTGIAPEQQPRIFERFFRADKSRSRDDRASGYGLGLSICHLIIRSLGGDISVNSHLGQGSVFTVTLPLVSEQWSVNSGQLSGVSGQ